MVPTQDGPLRGFTLISVLLLLTHSCGGVSKKTGPSHRVLVMVGDDAVLPCQLEPPSNAVSMTMEWGRPDLDPRFVFLWHEGQELLAEQNEAYKGRASLSIDNMKRGDVSLKLSRVKVSDSGTYRCYIPKINKEYFVELLVGAASSPATSLAGIDKSSSGVMLVCKSAGWYPEPEVLWLDGEGNLLSAGPTETVRGPDDLYTVSSRVTVEKRHSNSFTCRVQQKDTNQTREAQITVPEDFFVVCSGCAASTTFSVLFGLMLVAVVGFFGWKWRQNKTEIKTQSNKSPDEERQKDQRTTELSNTREQQILLKRNGSKEQLREDIKKMKELMQEMKKELKNEVEKQKEKLIEQMEKAEKLQKENDEKVKSLDEEIEKMEGDKTFNRGQRYLQLKEIIRQNSWNLQERKQDLQKLNMDTDNLIWKTLKKINTITGQKEEEKKDQGQEPNRTKTETMVSQETEPEKIDSAQIKTENETVPQQGFRI